MAALYIYAEDFASAIIGPFRKRIHAERHIEFCRKRGDADPGRIITKREAKTLKPNFYLTPEQDIEDGLLEAENGGHF